MSIYDLTVQDRKGKDVALADYRGKVLLIVNTATGCGFTPQYEDLQRFYETYHDQGLEILDFPCNQFGNQAPGTNDEIHTFCTGRFGITFPQMGKIDVNGENASPLYQYLTANTTFAGFDDNKMGRLLTGMLKKVVPDFAESPAIKWNFTKFLIGRDGAILGRFEPMTDMKRVEEAIKEAL